jgi:hypothetical protein
MIQKQALQIVLAVSALASASRAGALRLDSRLGPTTPALHLTHLRFRWRSQGLRRQTYTP